MKIIVAGAGHGGLTAAALLSAAGHDVSVLEKEKRENLGHDWEDRFTFEILREITGQEIPGQSRRYRGDCAFISPDYKTRVVVNYSEENRQKVMWRKPLLNMLIANAEKNGVRLSFGEEVLSALVSCGKVVGVETKSGEVFADLVIDAAGVFSPVRMSLPASLGIENAPERGDVFYVRRTYFEKTAEENAEAKAVPFEVYLCHNGEQGLSWCCTNENSVDILIGRIDRPDESLFEKHTKLFCESHPWFGEKVLHGGTDGVIPVRRPLALMVADGYAAVGDSAFMTTPMNGMGIDLSLRAGQLLAKTVIEENSADSKALWKYNRDFHRLYGAETARNESLKNTLLNLPPQGVSFLFESGVVQAGDLAGAGRNTKPSVLLGKFVRGMKKPAYFFSVLGGLMKGAKLSKALAAAPEEFEKEKVSAWQNDVKSKVLPVKNEYK